MGVRLTTGVQEADAGSPFARKVEAISQLTARWDDYCLQTVACRMDAACQEGDLTLGLVGEGKWDAPVWLHLARIRYLRMEDFREAGPCFVDGVRVAVLPARRADWPAAARGHTLRSWEGRWGAADLECEMVWVTVSGPWSLEAIAQIVHVSVTPPEVPDVTDDHGAEESGPRSGTA